MNKKSKRITLGLVSALCLLLVVALGFGVTGAWYRARRQATGTVVLDQGIILKVNNLNQNSGANYGASTPLDASNKLSGSFWELSVVAGDSNDTLVALNASSTQPGATATKYIAVPTIQAANGSTSFYAKAKLVTELTKFNAAHTDASAELGDTVTLDQLYVRSGTVGNYTYTAATAADLYDLADSNPGAPEFATGWVAVGTHGYMMYGSNNTTPTAITAGNDADGVEVAILKDDNADSADAALSTIGFDKVQLKEWTGGDNLNDPNQYVEIGGPKFYISTGEETYAEFEVARISYSIVIDVIQAANLTMGSGEAFETWRDAA